MFSHWSEDDLTHFFGLALAVATAAEKAEFCILACREPEADMEIHLSRGQHGELHGVVGSLELDPGERDRRISKSPRLDNLECLRQAWSCCPQEQVASIWRRQFFDGE